MRVRNLCVGVAAAAALSIPAAALAATPQQLFTGGFDESESTDAAVKIKTGATNGYRVKAFAAHRFAVSCDGDDGFVKRAAIKGRIPIGGKGRFHARDDNGKTVLNVRGEIDGRKAEGVFRFSGKLETAGGATHSCDSGRLEWSAKLTKGPDIGP